VASVQANGSHDTQNRYNNSIEDCPAWVTWNQCDNFLFRKAEYEYVLYSVRSIRMTKKTWRAMCSQHIRKE